MRRNCNLELRLFPSPASDHRSMMLEEEEEASESRSSPILLQEGNRTPLTIFYDGKISVCDVTHSQARSILMLARRELEERVRTPTSTSTGSSDPCSPALLQSSSTQQHNIMNNNNLHSPAGTSSSLSMKRSLQRFLQKRKNRLQETSPYHH
ncbi:hypothetical protein PIB30_011956 [Stylosanthes scabra]|uniref:Protein TIFY n=1 Tax=Stylosanthes scabra TaxID=79078 RepID=A0ABU6X3A9_9FABA|nr:hypothetical protein [Stylosanthes scabra]